MCRNTSGDVKTLAKRILFCPRITFQDDRVWTHNQKDGKRRAAFAQIANTGGQRACGGFVTVRPELLRAILSMTKKYTLVLGVMAINHDCNGGQHPAGRAIDINGISGFVNGKLVHTYDGNHIHRDGITGKRSFAENANSEQLIRNFYGDMSWALYNYNHKRGRLGQEQCFDAGKPSLAPGITSFTRDWCDHIHVDLAPELKNKAK